jgi:hypothetical protein
LSALAYFTVTGNLTAIVVDYVNDTDQDPDQSKITATVKFIPRVPRGQMVWAPGLTPPQGLLLSTIQARFDGDGYLRTIQNAAQNEVQLVTITGSPTGGTFTLSWNGQTTAAIAFNATTDVVQTRLAALSNLGVGNVQVGGNPGAWQVQFTGTLAATDVAQMTATSSLTGGTSPAVTVSTTKVGGLNAGVKLVANTADIGMDQLIYDVVVSNLNYHSMPDGTLISPFAFAAPTSAVTVDLSQLDRLPPKEGL